HLRAHPWPRREGPAPGAGPGRRARRGPADRRARRGRARRRPRRAPPDRPRVRGAFVTVPTTSSERAASPWSGRSHAELAELARELLLAGHLIDRSGMPHLIAAFGRDDM